MDADDPIQPAGQANHWTDAALAALLALTPLQVLAAEALWRAHAPASLAGLLARGSAPVWEADDQRYVRPNGRPVDPDTVAHAVLTFLAAVAWDLEHAAEEMATGGAALDQWRDAAAATVRSAYIAAYAVGAGGIDELTDSDLSAIRTRVADSLARLDRFAGLAERHDDAVATVGDVVDRAALYASPAWAMFEAGRAAGHERAGFTRERNVLEPGAEHCPGCDAMTELGWADIGTLVPIGERECGPGCRCRMDYRRDEVDDAKTDAQTDE